MIKAHLELQDLLGHKVVLVSPALKDNQVSQVLQVPKALQVLQAHKVVKDHQASQVLQALKAHQV